MSNKFLKAKKYKEIKMDEQNKEITSNNLILIKDEKVVTTLN